MKGYILKLIDPIKMLKKMSKNEKEEYLEVFQEELERYYKLSLDKIERKIEKKEGKQ